MNEDKKTNPLGMSSIQEALTRSPFEVYGELLRKSVSHDWIFSEWYEKLIVLGSVVFVLVTIGLWIWRMF